MLTRSRGEKWHKSKWNPGRTLTFSPPSPGSVTRRRWRTWWTWPYLWGHLKQLTQDLIFIHSFLKYWLWGSSWSMNVRLCRLILFPKKKRRDCLKVIKLIFESCCCRFFFFFHPRHFCVLCEIPHLYLGHLCLGLSSQEAQVVDLILNHEVLLLTFEVLQKKRERWILLTNAVL